MAERPQFQRAQYAFAAHIRDPEHNPAPAGIEDRRMAVYRDLFFNNVESQLAQCFPVLRKILPDDRWRSLVRDYFSQHRARTPYFLEVPQEFLSYVRDERGVQPDDPAFLYELAHYEWAELAVSVLDVPDEQLANIDGDGDLLDGIPVGNPAAWALAYAYDVHKIGPAYLPAAPPDEQTFLVVHRRADDSVGFEVINAVTARLLELIDRGEDKSGREILQRVATEMQHPNPQTVVDGGRQILEQLRSQDIVLGTRSSNNRTGAQPDG